MSKNIAFIPESTVELGYGLHWNERASKVFETLCMLAWPHLTHYHSDLYHDARWLRDNVDGNEAKVITFYFEARDYGTSIGTDPAIVHGAMGNGYACWRITLDNGKVTTMTCERAIDLAWRHAVFTSSKHHAHLDVEHLIDAQSDETLCGIGRDEVRNFWKGTSSSRCVSCETADARQRLVELPL